jgi:tetratricopeptide (TPR) repeat protein
MPSARLLLLGWGGADWRVLQPLLDAGHLPYLLSLVETGASGNLLSTAPANAASRWATVVTGHHADAHGILGWLRPGTDGQSVMPTTSADWRAPPLWDIVAAGGGRACAVGWPGTHPAARSAATVVSDAFATACGKSFDEWPVAEGTLWPRALADTLAETRLHPYEVTPDQILPFVPQAARIDQETDPRLPLLVSAFARAVSVHGAGTWLAEHADWELLCVHFEMIERLSASFMAYRAPRMPQVSQTDFEIYRDVVDSAYQFMDLLLGRYLALVGPQTRVMVVSAHGFLSGHLRPAPGHAEFGDPVAPRYRQFGIFVAGGPGVRRDELVLSASALDIAPTVLHMLGRPVLPGLPGRVLDEIVDGRPPPAAVPIETGTPPIEADALAIDPQWAASRVQELIRLGYLPPLSGDPEAAAEQVEIMWLASLAEVKAARGDHREALAALAQALALDPGRVSTRLAIAQSYHALGDSARCREVLEDLVATGLRGPFLDYLFGQLCLREGNASAAREHLQRAEDAGIGGRLLLERIGRVHLLAADWDAAENCFRRALEIDPDFAFGHHGLGLALAGRGCHAEAVEHLRRSTGLIYAQPQVHLDLGRSLAAIGRLTAAAESFGRALALSPGFAEARAALGYVQALIARRALDEDPARQARMRGPGG